MFTDLLLSSASLCILLLSIGDIVPLSLIIHHYEPLHLTQAIDITLIRTVEIRNGK